MRGTWREMLRDWTFTAGPFDRLLIEADDLNFADDALVLLRRRG
jgi:hypothetical protein